MKDRSRTWLYLQDMRTFAQTAIRLIEGISEEAFAQNLEKQLAVTRAVEIIGEAAKSVPDDVRALAPEIPWRSIIGTRDKLAHHYFGVDMGILWRVVRDDLPQLVLLVGSLIDLLRTDRDSTTSES